MATFKCEVEKVHGNLDHADIAVVRNGTDTLRRIRISKEEFRDFDAVDFTEFIELSLGVLKARRTTETTEVELSALMPTIEI